jgi:hypothetical protein
MVGMTFALSLAFAGLLGSGVASAHSGHPGGGGSGHGAQNGSGAASEHGGHPAGGGGGAEAHGTSVGGGAPTSGANDSGGSVPDTGGKVGGDTGTHGKKGGKKGGPVALTGSTTCSVRGKMTFDPPLKSGGTATSTVTVTGLLTRCTTTGPGKAKFNNGHLSALAGTFSANDCTALTSGAAPALSGGSIMWTPPSKVAASDSVSMPAGTGSTVTHGGKTVLQLSYSGGSVGSGSFTNAGSSSMQVTSIQDTTQISGRCTNGLSNVAFSGTVTL